MDRSRAFQPRITREVREQLPPLIEDARSNPLVRHETPDGPVYLRPVHSPYVERHALVIPDGLTHDSHMPGVVDVPTAQFHTVFEMSRYAAEFFLNDTDVVEVDIGGNTSPEEEKKIIASQRKDLHWHIFASTREDLSRKPTSENVPSYKRQVSEPLQRLITDVMDTQVYATFIDDPRFIHLLTRIPDGNRITFQLNNGIDTLSDPDFASLVQDIHKQIISVYNEATEPFFMRDEDGTIQKDTETNRYLLHDKEVRIAGVAGFSAEHPELSSHTHEALGFLAEQAVQKIPTKTVDLNGEQVTVDDRDRMLVKGPAMATAITGIRDEQGIVTWRFGIDPILFSERASNQASRGTEKLATPIKGAYYDEAELTRVKKREAELKAYIEEKMAA